MDPWNLVFQVVILLLTALVFGGVLSRLGQSPLVGYLLAGMFLGGPGSVGLVGTEGHIDAIAELGVALLLFSLGLEFSWRRLKGLGGRSLLGGVAQVAGTGVAAGAVAAAAGAGAAEAAAVGGMVALSSTAVVLRLLSETGDLDAAHGRDALAILLVQDMAVVPLALMMALLGGDGGGGGALLGAGKTLLLAAAFVFGLWLLVDKVAARVLGTLTLERNRELTVILAVATGLGSTWAAHAIGLSPALGAFVAGMFLGASPFAVQIRADVSSLRTVLLTLFFGAVGIVADPLWILANLPLVAGVAALVVAGKAVLVAGVLRALRRPLPVALAAGLGLAQVGEFAFVLGNTGRASGVVSAETYALVVSVAIVTLFLAPFLVPRAPRLAALLLRRPAPARDRDGAAEAGPELVIVGFGPAGRAIGERVRDRGRKVLVLDLNERAIRDAIDCGFRAEIGDAGEPEVLEHAGVDRARLVAITLPARSAAAVVLARVRLLAPCAHVVVRSRYRLHEEEYRKAGAHAVIGDEDEVGRRLAEHVASELAREAT